MQSRLVEQFGSRTMASTEQLISLFYYMGMLTIGRQPEESAVPRLEIPNLVIRELQWEFLALALKDQEHIWIDTQELEGALGAMAVRGDIEPLLALFQEQVIAKIGVKDQRQFNEKTLKLMLLAYISQSRMFRILSEKEFARGYCDLFLGLSEVVPAARFAWMLEVKYLPTQATRRAIEAAFAQAEAQLERYTSDADLVPLLTLGKELRAGALVFVGAREVLFRPWPRPREKRPAKPAKPAGSAKRPPARSRKRG
ncbi:MAG: PD-(D/E)XK nuclease domain-containing protein [Polyangiaceae bacterium]|nr:PD-(D/E)XK nuclease domain-containing protein [Polyangiaceae bacterium]